jgi:DNA invertase Pin-like site-specific DNA recombinase
MIMSKGMTRAGLYARVSTTDQTPANQLDALRAFAAARGWVSIDFVDHGFRGRRSGARRSMPSWPRSGPARWDVVACVKLDRLARSTHHLVSLAKELEAVLDQAIDTTTPAGRLLFHVLAAIAEFERDLIRDRVRAGIRRAKAQGRRLGRPRQHHVDPARARALLADGLSLRAVARALKTHATTVRRALAARTG